MNQAAPNNSTIHQGPRIPAQLFDGEVTIPLVTSAKTSGGMSAVTSLVSIAALIGFALFGSGFGGAMSAYLPLLLITSGIASLASILVFIAQWRASRRAANDLGTRYKTRLDELEHQLNTYNKQESSELATQFPALNNIAQLWQRRPSDPDFLQVRVGEGARAARYRVRLDSGADTLTSPQPGGGFIALQKRARKMVAYGWLSHAPVTCALRDHSSIAIIADNGSSLLAAIIAQIVAHHAPGDVLPIPLYSSHSDTYWTWFESASGRDRYYEAANLGRNLRAPATTKANRDAILKWLLRELQERESAIARQQAYANHDKTPMLPHIVLSIDSSNLRQADNPMQHAAVAQALARGQALGVTVLSSHIVAEQAPADTSLILNTKEGMIMPRPNDLVVPSDLNSDYSSAANGDIQVIFDGATDSDLNTLKDRLDRSDLEHTGAARLAADVRLAPQLGLPDFSAASFPGLWSTDPSKPITIPIGELAGGDKLLLNLSPSSEKGDGPHGLLVGQTGSGKSVLLKSIIAALITQYSPEVLNLVLVDYKGGLAFDAFKSAPHTIATLTNLVDANATQRFLRMMESEILARQTVPGHHPHLFVVIDEFSEMLSGPDGQPDSSILRSLMRIVRLGRELQIHLLFATQRPDNNTSRLLGAVQYRICLRTNTPDDSNLVLGSPVAASITFRTPGRGYILRGDNQLIEFQSARLNDPEKHEKVNWIGDTEKLMRSLNNESLKSRRAVPWPLELPIPTPVNRTPLVLPDAGTIRTLVQTWSKNKSQAQLAHFAIPIGRYDRPLEREQGVLHAALYGYTGRLNGGPLVVAGDNNTGKTTTLQTLVLSLAETQGPDAVRYFIIGAEDAFMDFKRLPHTWHNGDQNTVNVADPYYPDTVEALLKRFQTSLDDPQRTATALLLVIDDITDPDLKERFGPKKPHSALLDRAIRVGRNQRDDKTGVFVAYSMLKADYDMQHLVATAATRISLFSSDSGTPQSLLGRKPPFDLEPAPGRGFVYTRESVDEIQVLAPVPGQSDAEIAVNLATRIESISTRWGAVGR